MNLRPELTPLPERMKALPVDPERGYPIPWFVDYLDGKPEFRAMDPRKWRAAVKQRLCWVCGQKLGAYLCFVLGPMCGVSRTTSEPPVHLECGRWSVVNCPFLSRPAMDRREMEETAHAAGMPILRNPGVALLWLTHTFEVFKVRDGNEGYLITVGPSIEVEWWACGKPATWREVNDSVTSGLPFLEAEALKEEGAMRALYIEVDRLKALYPQP